MGPTGPVAELSVKERTNETELSAATTPGDALRAAERLPSLARTVTGDDEMLGGGVIEAEETCGEVVPAWGCTVAAADEAVGIELVDGVVEGSVEGTEGAREEAVWSSVVGARSGARGVAWEPTPAAAVSDPTGSEIARAPAAEPPESAAVA